MSQNVNKELKNIVEAALLVAGQPLTIERLSAMFPAESRPTKEELREVLQHIEEDFADRGVELKQIGKGWRIQTKEKYAELVAKLLEERPPRYSRALLEVLAIIVYRQPVTRGEIENIRGVAVNTDTIRTLTERGWIKQVGVREVAGRPALYGTTPSFLEHFNLTSLSDMPPLAELRSIEEIGAELDQRMNEALQQPQGGATHGGNGNVADASAETAADAMNVATETVDVAVDETQAVESAISEPEVAPAVEAQPLERE
jgi:segregation and condensation protein B